MAQNLVSLKLTDAELTTLNGALDTIQTTLAGRTVSLDPGQRRTLVKMGDKTRPFCEDAVAALQSNSAALPPGFALGELADDMTDFEKLNPFFDRLTTVRELVDDTLKAISSDVMTNCIAGVGVLKALNKLNPALDESLKNLSNVRRKKAAKKSKPPTP
jgi:hypothetical protein